MSKAIASIKLSETLTISECPDGFWLYDKTRGMNIAMRTKTKDEAFIKSLAYYQQRLSTIEEEYTSLKSKVDLFVAQFVDEGQGWND